MTHASGIGRIPAAFMPALLRSIVMFLENPLVGPLVAGTIVRRITGGSELRGYADARPTMLPLHPYDVDPSSKDDPPEYAPRQTHQAGFPFRTVRDYAGAYEKGIVTPQQVAERALAAIHESDRHQPPMRMFIAVDENDVMTRAGEASDRYRKGRRLSILDGVPVAIKDQIDAAPYPTTEGTRFLGARGRQSDSPMASKLRAHGALLLGKTSMPEVGSSASGWNSIHGYTRNPYNLLFDPGGSSSGSAAAVASGIVPISLGADSGGSIRIPASFCGVVGLKTTFGRIAACSAAPLAWSVMGYGPLAASVEDAAIAYATIAGQDLAMGMPRLRLPDRTDVRGLYVGIDRRAFNETSADVVRGCTIVLEQLAHCGAHLEDVSLPPADDALLATSFTMVAEAATALRKYPKHEFSWPTRMTIALAEGITAGDYIRAQQVRTGVTQSYLRELHRFDAIATPTVPTVAPPINEGGPPGGFFNYRRSMDLMRFTCAANLVGLPAITIPVGYSDTQLPLGLQFIGRPWDEAILLKLGYVTAGMVQTARPAVLYDLLPEAGTA